MMKLRTDLKLETLIIAASLVAPAVRAEETASQQPVKVFILAGQSNMEGQGVVEMDHPKYYNGGKGNLVWSMAHSKSADKMKHLKDAD
ncbi:MAG: sialate O-acetylesterase, partial [Planctomycetota bacterium]|nr:sialate O-acetylesterase [Planctomycetota bacterium]